MPKAIPPFTRFSSYKNDELLRMLDEKRSQSPIIDELCHRLEAAFEMNMTLDITDYRPIEKDDQVKIDNEEKEVIELKVHCPCCEGNFTVDVTVDNFTVTLNAE